MKQLLLLAFALITSVICFAQVPPEGNQSFEQGLARLHETLDTVDFHRIFDQFDARFQEFRPSDAEIDNMKESLSSALDKMESIDFDKIQDQFTDILEELEGVFGEFSKEMGDQSKPADSKLKKI